MRVILYSELKSMIDKKEDFTLLDVREKDELGHGIIPSSKNLPLSEFNTAFNLDQASFKKKYGFFIEKNKPVVVYCRTGGRSGRAAQFLESRGYDVLDFSGSVQEWSKHDKNVHMY